MGQGSGPDLGIFDHVINTVSKSPSYQEHFTECKILNTSEDIVFYLWGSMKFSSCMGISDTLTL